MSHTPTILSVRYLHRHRGLPQVAATILSAFILLALLAACGYGRSSTTTKTTTTTPPGGSPAIDAHINGTRGAQNDTVTTTAHCPSGEALVSGGFGANIFESDAIVASYPSAPDAWTVTGSSAASSMTLTAYAYCLQSSTGFTVQMAHQQVTSSSASVSCPAGAVLTGGGFAGGATRSSYPNGNGWALDASGGQGATVWAVCATHGLASAPVASARYTLPVGFGNEGSGTVSCGAGERTIGGGFRDDGDYALTYSAFTVDTAGWSVGVEANASSPSATPGGTVFAVCVTPAR